MTSFYKKHSHIFISIFSILALFAFFVLSKKDSNGFLNLFSFPSSGNIVNDPLLHSIAVIHNSSTLSKSVSSSSSFYLFIYFLLELINENIIFCDCIKDI